MNEQLQGAVAQILDRAISGIDSSVDFMQAELPDVIEQLLMWYSVKGAILTLVGVAILFVMLRVDYKSFKKIDSDDSMDGLDMVMYYGLLGSVARLLYFIPIMMINLEWLQIWIAPKIWLMEYAASLVK